MKRFRILFVCMVLAVCTVFSVGCNSVPNNISASLFDVRNNGTAIQWKYNGESDWHDLVALDELKAASGQNGADGKDGANGIDGTDGQNGIDGKNGVNGQNGKNGKNGKKGKNGKDGSDGINGENGNNGKDGENGADGKTVEVRKDDSYIQWRYANEQWQNLVAIEDITGPSGQNGANGADGADGANGENGRTPEFRVNDENTLQWRYVGDEIWLNLYELSLLKGADGQNGADGKDGTNGINGIDGQNGKDGNTPFIGENGNWWIGETDTGIKAAGQDGEKGDKGDRGDKGDKGDQGEKGEKGDAGRDGSCPGYFYAEGRTPSVLLNNGPADISVFEKINSGGLISSYNGNITLKKGHVYNVSVSGSLGVRSNTFDNSGHYGVQMRDNYDNDFCREITRIKRDGKNEKIQFTNNNHSFNFNRMYDASAKDITLQFWFEQYNYNTYLIGFRGAISITALN